jgi:hypothetical protein
LGEPPGISLTIVVAGGVLVFVPLQGVVSGLVTTLSLAVLLLGLVFATNAIGEWVQQGHDFRPYVAGRATSNLMLDLGVQRPTALWGIRCGVTRSREQPRQTRYAEKPLHGVCTPSSDWPSFNALNYPSQFEPQQGSMPERGETCTVAWSVKTSERGDWVPVGNPRDFTFGVLEEESRTGSPGR